MMRLFQPDEQGIFHKPRWFPMRWYIALLILFFPPPPNKDGDEP